MKCGAAEKDSLVARPEAQQQLILERIQPQIRHHGQSQVRIAYQAGGLLDSGEFVIAPSTPTSCNL